MMPFSNFQDTVSAKLLYSLFLQEDSDGDVLEFITNDMLNIGGVFEDEDNDKGSTNSQQQEHPLQPLQITPGFLYCAQSLLYEEKEQTLEPRVFCRFVDNKYKQDYSSFIFHPPTLIG